MSSFTSPTQYVLVQPFGDAEVRSNEGVHDRLHICDERLLLRAKQKPQRSDGPKALLASHAPRLLFIYKNGAGFLLYGKCKSLGLSVIQLRLKRASQTMISHFTQGKPFGLLTELFYHFRWRYDVRKYGWEKCELAHTLQRNE